MKRFAVYAAVLLAAALLAGCKVHEWPKVSEKERFVLDLRFDTGFTLWDHVYDGSSLTEEGSAPAPASVPDKGYMHCIVRAYPAAKGNARALYYDEFTFTRDISSGLDCEFPVELEPGSYTVMVWAELTELQDGPRYYDPTDFNEIRLTGDHAANTDYRDAFRGTAEIHTGQSSGADVRTSVLVGMQRPLAKFEFITTDLADFLKTESAAFGPAAQTSASAEDYGAIFYYAGFMPSAYSMTDDRPVDSSPGVVFLSELRRTDSGELSMGFDYVFVNDTESSVTVQLEVYRKSDKTTVARSKPVRIPLRRSFDTVVRGQFLSDSSSGGIGVDPDYGGDHNIFI